jgi:outer membrane protein assembly factor BamB
MAMRPVWKGITRRHRVGILAITLPLATLVSMTGPASALGTDPWAMAQYGPARVGYNPHETVIGIGNAHTLTESWSAPIGTDLAALEPVVANGLAYISNGEDSPTVTAYRLTNGSTAWTHAGPESDAPNAVIGSDLWVTAGYFPGRLEELNALSGAVNWSVGTPHGGAPGEPAVLGSAVYAFENGADANYYVDAFNASDGSSLWTAQVSGTISATLMPAPAVSGGRVFVLDDDATNHLVIDAFNATNGHLDWTYDTHAKDRGFPFQPATVSIQSNQVIFAYGTHVWSINAATGHLHWTHTESGADYTTQQPMDAYGDIFTFNGSHDEALSQSTGHVVWTSSTADIDVSAVADQVIFGTTTTAGSVYVKAISALNGSLLWTSTAISPTIVEAPIVVADGVVLAVGLNSANDPILYEFAPS